MVTSLFYINSFKISSWLWEQSYFSTVSKTLSAWYSYLPNLFGLISYTGSDGLHLGTWPSFSVKRLPSTGPSCCLVTQSHPTLCHPMDCNLPGSSLHGISQARILEWVVISYSRGFFPNGNWTLVSLVSCIVGRFFTTEPSRKPHPLGLSAYQFLCLKSPYLPCPVRHTKEGLENRANNCIYINQHKK